MQLGMSEMIFIFLLALVIFGPKKLPEIGRQLGKAMNEFKRASNEFRSQLEEEIRQIDVAEQTKKLAASAESLESNEGTGRPVPDELTIAPPRESIAQDSLPSEGSLAAESASAGASTSNGNAPEIISPAPLTQEING